MVKIRYLLNILNERFTATFHHEAAVNVFCKVLYIFLFFKIIFTWDFPETILHYFPPTESSSLLKQIIFFPGWVASVSYAYFALLYLVILLIAIILKRNYLTAIIIAWWGLSYYKINFLTSNGSDYILLMLLFFAIPMSSYPRAKDEIIFFLQKVGHNTGLVICQIQVALIYLISGLDKVESEIWRTGDAIQYIDRLSFLANPHLKQLLLPGELMPFILAWLTIIFELSFPLLVWFKEFRPFVLIAGVIFHLSIAILLTLPDFGLIMIVAYIPFITTLISNPFRKKKIAKPLKVPTARAI